MSQNHYLLTIHLKNNIINPKQNKIYKWEISKSGTAILPAKRTKRIPEKINPNYNNLKDRNEDKNEEPKQQEELKSLPTDNTSKE